MEPATAPEAGATKVLQCTITDNGFPQTITKVFWFRDLTELSTDEKYVRIDTKGISVYSLRLCTHN